MTHFRLANVLFASDDFMVQNSELFYRSEGMTRTDSDGSALAFTGEVDFLTYFNAFSNAKWRKYASLDNVWLHLELSGAPCDVVFEELGQDGTVHAAQTPLAQVAVAADAQIVDVQLPDSTSALVGFKLVSKGEARVSSAYFYAVVEEEKIRPVKLAVSTTTFRKEEFILPNIETIKRDVLGSDEPIARSFHLFVVDNGRTLDAAELSDNGVTVLANPNVGGSGGFARGMMEAMDSPAGYTHVLLMDDDVKVFPESFKRTFNLLSLANEHYKDAFVNGAMLSLEEPTLQYEDVAYILDHAAYRAVKGQYHVGELADIAENERVDVEVPNAYGAWWFSCIPVSAVREHGLPLPFFVRCDDVEYGARCNPTYMVMNGICVWHASFEGRYKPSVDCYQYYRNFPIMMAVDGKCSEFYFKLHLRKSFYSFLRHLYYDACDLILDGIEDFMRGPQFLEEPRGEELMKSNGKKNEKYFDYKDLDQNVVGSLDLDGYAEDSFPGFGMVARVMGLLPFNLHMLPKGMLKKNPAVTHYSLHIAPWTSTMWHATQVALNPRTRQAAIRTIDYDRYHELRKRYKRVIGDYNRRGGEIRKQYRDAMPYLTSEKFWKAYLGL